LDRAEIDGLGITPGGRPGLVDDPAAYGRAETWVAQQSARVGIMPGWESGLQLGFHRIRPRVRMNGVTVESDSRLLLLRWRNVHGPSGSTVPLDAWRIAWGADARREEGQAEGPGIRFEGHRTQAAGFADLEANRGPWSGMAGLRLDRYDAHGTRLTYYLGLGFQASPRLSLRASGGHGYRIPSYVEWNFPFFGNPALRPESSDGGQIGFDWTPVENMRISATGYYQRYDDLIRVSFVPTTGFFFTANVPRARVGGVEGEMAYEFAPFTVGVNYTLQASEDLDTGRSLARLPRNLGKLFGSWRSGSLPLVFSAEAVYREGYDDDTGGVLRMGDAWWVNAQALYRVASWAEVYVRGENLSNDLTPDDFSYGKPGMAVYGGLRLAFR
jgi:vitamin B12 transporter